MENGFFRNFGFLAALWKTTSSADFAMNSAINFTEIDKVVGGMHILMTCPVFSDSFSCFALAIEQHLHNLWMFLQIISTSACAQQLQVDDENVVCVSVA